MSSINFLGIIQARMGSERLPGKSLLQLGDRSLLEWVWRRCKRSELVDRWVIATSVNQSSDAIVKVSQSLGAEVYRGSEEDVLSRYISCISRYEPKYVVRVCADNPFVWGELIDHLLRQICEGDVYLANHRPHQFCSIADGFGAEVFLAQELVKNVASNPSSDDREHVTASISSVHSHRQIQVPKQLETPYLRVDVDTQSDLDVLRDLVKVNSLTIDSPPEAVVASLLATQLQEVLEDLFPLNRSLAGEESRRTLSYLKDVIPLQTKRIPTGSRVFDWEVPPEWSVKEGWIKGRDGRRIIDFKQEPLHVVSYSAPVNKNVNLNELKEHLHVHQLEDAIPYRTAYYARDWGFAISQRQLKEIVEDGGPFQVFIESEFLDGYLDYADLVVPGKSKLEILVSSYICHPSLANDSLSGVILSVFLARHLLNKKNLKYTYRFVFVPETIGALVYLSELGKGVENIFCGLQVTTVGGPGKFQCKKSWNAAHPINRIATEVLEASGCPYSELAFDVHGSDERQYSSPAFRINMLTIAKDIYYSYPQYHSSFDNLDFVRGESIRESLVLYIELIDKLEQRRIFSRTDPRGEPMLSRHDLYRQMGGSLLPGKKLSQLDLTLWILFYCDGSLTTVDIAHKLDVEISVVENLCEILAERQLLSEV